MNDQFGKTIRQLRHSQLQIHNGKPWSQEDLAVAIGSSKPHINRIENGRQTPNVQTLTRICDALDVNWNQRKQIFALAGYPNISTIPFDDEISNIVSALKPQFKEIKYALTLLDDEMRMWAVNDIEALSFYGYPSAEKFINECGGLRFIELLGTPYFYDWFSRIIVNFDVFFRRQVLLFMETYLKYRTNPEYDNMLNQFFKLNYFKNVWDELWNNREFEHSLVFLDHQSVKINHPDLGLYSVQIWHCRLAFDSRFRITIHTPDDIDSMKLFDSLNLHYQKK